MTILIAMLQWQKKYHIKFFDLSGIDPTTLGLLRTHATRYAIAHLEEFGHFHLYELHLPRLFNCNYFDDFMYLKY